MAPGPAWALTGLRLSRKGYQPGPWPAADRSWADQVRPTGRPGQAYPWRTPCRRLSVRRFSGPEPVSSGRPLGHSPPSAPLGRPVRWREPASLEPAGQVRPTPGAPPADDPQPGVPRPGSRQLRPTLGHPLPPAPRSGRCGGASPPAWGPPARPGRRRPWATPTPDRRPGRPARVRPAQGPSSPGPLKLRARQPWARQPSVRAPWPPAEHPRADQPAAPRPGDPPGPRPVRPRPARWFGVSGSRCPGRPSGGVRRSAGPRRS
jgi:hypothetical protein